LAGGGMRRDEGNVPGHWKAVRLELSSESLRIDGLPLSNSFTPHDFTRPQY
jgi:hypothetical protein